MPQAIFTEGAAPATPATGKVAVYAKTDGKMYALDDAGLERSLGGDAASTTQAGIVEMATEAEVVTGTSTTLVPSVDSFRKANVVSGSVVTASGTSVDFSGATGIPSWAKQITVMFSGLSTNGTSPVMIQLGDSGGVENTGYTGMSSLNHSTGTNTYTGLTSGFPLTFSTHTAANEIRGAVTLSLVDAATFTWVIEGKVMLSSQLYLINIAGDKSLTAALDRIRITTVGGTDTFDAGKINILYE